MSRYILFIAMIIGLLSSMYPKVVFGDVSANEHNSDVSMTITSFQVNDQDLELGWKITNSSDHDVWICDNITVGSDFDWFLDNDDETLKIIKRSSLPQGQGWEHWPWVRFIRLHPGEEKHDSISLTLPVRPSTLFSHQRGNAEYARRVAIEIGFYDEDLRGLILNIVDLTEQLSCDTSLLSSIVTPGAQIPERFFAGVYIAQVFHDKSFGGFRNKVLSDGDEISMPFMNQLFHGEKVLRATIDGVSIPYKSNYPPLTDEPPQSETEPAGVTMALTGLDVNDTNLELRWTIKNGYDHDVWICDYVFAHTQYPEVYLAEDKQTLMIRKRLDVPKPTDIWWTLPPIGRYVRLRPGEERSESLSITLPVIYETVFASTEEIQGTVYAKRLVLEIGFYNEDLPGLIRGIIEVAERLGCARLEPNDLSSDIIRHYYKGLLIKNLFGGLSHFDESHSGSSGYFSTTCTEQLLGEQSLLIIVDGVSIP